MICEHYAANSALDLLSLPPFYLSTCVFMTRKKKQWEVCKYAFRRDKKYLHWIPNDFTDGFRFGLRGETKPLPLCDLHKNPQVGGWMKHFETKWKSLLKFPPNLTQKVSWSNLWSSKLCFLFPCILAQDYCWRQGRGICLKNKETFRSNSLNIL